MSSASAAASDSELRYTVAWRRSAVVNGNRIEDLIRHIHESDAAAGRAEVDGADDNYR